jgi:hypothetical protein
MRQLLAMAVVMAVMVASVASADTVLSGNAYLDGSGNLVGTALTAASGAGTQASPYVFNVTGNLDLNGYNISGASSINATQHSATYVVTGDVLNSGATGGSFLSYTNTNYRDGGDVRIDADGSIDVNNVWTKAQYQRNAGDIYLWAKDGSVTLDGRVDTRTGGGTYYAGHVVMRSEGTLANQGITIDGTSGGYSVVTRAFVSYATQRAGNVSLYTEGDVYLEGGINSRGGTGNVLVRGATGDPNAVAGDVEINGSIDADSTTSTSGRHGGDLTVLAESLLVNGNILAYNSASGLSDAGTVRIDVTGDATIEGYIRADCGASNYQSSPGTVDITALHIAVNGANSGVSIDTTDVRTGDYHKDEPATPGNVTLTGVDTSSQVYYAGSALTGSTSSIYLAGGIETAFGSIPNNPDFYGHVNISAVEVQIGGDVTVEHASSQINVHYGVTEHGAITHLMEDGVYGYGDHNITYGVSTPSFFADVEHATPVAEPAGLGLLGLALACATKSRRSRMGLKKRRS